MTFLIVNADDYGRTAGVSAGIREAHRRGLVSTTTVMVNLPGALHQIRLAMDETPDLGLGVHLNLTFGPSCLPSDGLPALLDSQGFFHTKDALLQRLDQVDVGQVEREWRAQIEALLSTGADLDHLDSHHHVAAFSAPLWELYLHLAVEFGCGVRSPSPADVDDHDLLGLYPESMIAFMRGPALERVQALGVRTPDHFLASFFGASATRERLLALLQSPLQGVAELMCHPGFVDNALLQSSSYAADRQSEFELLTDPHVLQAVRAAGIQLRTFKDAWTTD